jgi:DNA-binding NtrC family response regulator
MRKSNGVEPLKKAKKRIISEFERSYIEKLLLLNQGNITKAAARAHKDRRTFWGLIRKYGIDADKYRSLPT